MSTGLLLDGVFASEAIDSSGEILDIDGLDISDFDEGKGVANYEHKGHEGNTNGEEIVGKIVYSHKVFEASDCTNDRERMFWDKVKLPFLYGVVRLYDGAGHEGAKALAAIVRDSHANEEPIVVGFSIEGSTLEKDKNTNRLKSTIAKRVALTLRPCNKTAVSGLLADPNAPEGYEKHPVKPDLLAMVPMGKQTATKKGEHDDSRFMRLGGSEAIYGSDITKAMSAGSYGAAPGTLTGGAALQVEDRTLKAMAHAAYRDWDRVTPFKKFLKTQMPEASDEFINHFSDIVDRHLFRVRKAVEVVTDLKKEGKLMGPKDAGISVQPLKKEKPRLTIQGRVVPQTNPLTPTPSFDSASGTLYTKRGAFQASTPSKPHPHLVRHMKSIGVDPKVHATAFSAEVQKSRQHHLRAMQNWFKVNDKFSKGDVDPGVVSHAVAFALMSPGVPVPIQETMYGHYMDAVKNQGMSSVNSEGEWNKVHKDWMGRNRSGLPQHSRQHFVNLEDQIRAKDGNFIGYSKPAKFSEYFGGYLKDHHHQVMEAIKDAKGDAHVVARKLTDVRGIAPKLSRYLLGMMGAGNMVVPDTHFIRHYFGARPDAPGSRPGMSPDSDTINHLKQTLLDSTSSHDLLEGMDNHYFQNHDAVKHVLNDPQMGPYFKGREQQAIFPAFWSHWISIPGHENAIGTPNQYSSNEGTDHAPFWDAIHGLHKSEEQYDPDLHMKTAQQHHRWMEQYGQNHALGLYYRYLVPKLLANDALAAQAQSPVMKMEEYSVELLKTLEDRPTTSEPRWHEPAPATEKPIKYMGREIKPGVGKVTAKGGNIRRARILHVGMNEAHVVDADKFSAGVWGHDDIVRYPRHQVEIHVHPSTQDEPDVVDHAKHSVGEYNSHPAVKALAHGFNFSTPKEMSKALSASHGRSFWSSTPAGARVFVKPNPVVPDHVKGHIRNRARYEGAYSNIARDFFGMGQYVPTVATVKHPKSNTEHAIVSHAPGEEYNQKNPDHQNILREHNDSGELDKLALMNMVMGNGDRHVHNYLIDSKARQLRMIDHDRAFSSGENQFYPAYWSHHHAPPGPFDHPLGVHEHAKVVTDADSWNPSNKVSAALGENKLHPKAVAWINSLDPKELEAQLRKHELSEEQVMEATKRLTYLKSHVAQRPDTDKDSAYVLPQLLARNK
jgi:hypothetical protein